MRQRLEQIDYEEPVLVRECKARLGTTHQSERYICSGHEARASQRLVCEAVVTSWIVVADLPPGNREANAQQSESEGVGSLVNENFRSMAPGRKRHVQHEARGPPHSTE